MLRPRLTPASRSGWVRRLAVLLAWMWVAPAFAQMTITGTDAADPSDDGTARTTIPITGDRLSGVVLPIEPMVGTIEFRALTANRWRVDDTRRLRLVGDVRIDIAGHEFRGPRATVWLNRLPTDDGPVNQIAVYFNEVTNPSRPTAVGIAGNQLLITAATRGDVLLDVASVRDRRPANDGVVLAGERRLRDALRELVARGSGLSPLPRIGRPGRRPATDDLPGTVDVPEAGAAAPWLRAPGSSISFSAADLQLQTGPDENVVVATGGFVVEYFADDDTSVPSQLTLTAERAVVFTDPGAIDDLTRRTIDASFVRGIYLEGDVNAVADRGEQVLRAPKVYYDFAAGRAIMLDAVLRTYARGVEAPVYARASEMRQIAEDQFTAKNVRVSASEYAVGHLAIGASRMTISQRPIRVGGGDVEADIDEDAGRETFLDAEGVTLRAGGVPFFWWPGFSGRLQDLPLRRVSFSSAEETDIGIETAWDLQALTGLDFGGFDAELRLDGYYDRGAGAGIVLTGPPDAPTTLDLYYLRDDGTDRTPAGRRVNQDDANRGIALWEQRLQLSRDWRLVTQGAFISDPTFVSGWRDEDFRNRREYQTGGRLEYQQRETAFAIDTTYRPNDFLSNGWLIASQGYSVDRLPEVSWRRFGDALFDGALTSSLEWRAGRVRIRFDESTPRELGIRPGAYPIGIDTPIADFLAASGLEQRIVNRFDARHELALPIDAGPVRVTPFLVGRFTAYDDDFSELAPQQEESMRVWGAAGVRASTRFQRVFDDVQSDVLDLHRLRWIIEPSVVAMVAATDVRQTELPVFDAEVESLANGAMASAGVRNVFQTQRGGPGHRRSVDVLALDTRVVAGTNDLDRESPSPRFIDFRPEYSQAGDHVYQSMIWNVSDSVALVGEGIYDLDESDVTRSSLGLSVQHSPILRTYAEWRRIDASDQELLDLGWDYRLTPKYSLFVRPTYDFTEGDFRAVLFRVTRRFPDFDFTLLLNYDQIRDDTSLGASVGFVTF